MGPGPPVWGLAVGLTAPPRNKLPRSDLRFGEGPLWGRMPALGYSTNEEEEIYAYEERKSE